MRKKNVFYPPKEVEESAAKYREMIARVTRYGDKNNGHSNYNFSDRANSVDHVDDVEEDAYVKRQGQKGPRGV